MTVVAGLLRGIQRILLKLCLRNLMKQPTKKVYVLHVCVDMSVLHVCVDHRVLTHMC